MSKNRARSTAMQQHINKKSTPITTMSNTRKQLPKQKSPSQIKVIPPIIWALLN